MDPERRFPEDPLGFIQGCVDNGHVLWTYHANMRLADRFVPREAIVSSADSFELKESYPDDKYLPSYLVFAGHAHGAFHVLFAADVEGDNVRVVTAYRPDPREWHADLKSRRRSP